MEFRVKNIWKSYNNFDVIKAFSYEFKEGLYLVIGKNGSGKSTLLKILARYYKPTNTNYLIDKIKVSYCSEVVELPSINSLNYLKMIFKYNKVKDKAKAYMEIWKIPDKNILFLSKGNKRKISLLQSLTAKSNLYLFDEPLDSLDDETIKLFVNYINDLVSLGKIVIVVTHDIKHFKDYKEINLCL